MSDTDPYISIAAAAKAVGMNRVRMREVCIAAGIAKKWGGSDEHPYLKVRLSAVRRALDRLTYTPPAPVSRHKKRRPVLSEAAMAGANPDVRC